MTTYEHKFTPEDIDRMRATILLESALGKIRVCFTKKDGTERILNGTRKLALIPEEFHPKGESENFPPENINLVPIFDLEANGWRSFDLSRIRWWSCQPGGQQKASEGKDKVGDS